MSVVSMENQLPSWLNRKFLEKVICSYKKDKNVEIVSYEKEDESFIQDHYNSKLYCLKIVFKTSTLFENELKVVVKTEIDETISMSEILKKSLSTENEIKMYLKSIPMINDLMNRHGMKCQLAPDLIYATLEPHPVLIIKNMCDEDYNAPDGFINNPNEVKMIFKRLAQFHAASYHFAENLNENFDDFSTNIFHNEEYMEMAFAKRIRILKDVVATWKGYEDYVPRLEYIAKNVVEIGRNCYIKNKPGVGYNVLNHGNLHSRNILTKYRNKTKQLEDFQFIDFQESIYCSPAYDFAYTFTMLQTEEIEMSKVVSYYHEEFVKALQEFGHLKTIPTLLDLNVEILRHSIASMLIEMIFIPAFFISRVSSDDIIASNEVEKRFLHKIKILNSPECKKSIQKSLKSWLEKGYLERKCE